MYSDKVNPSPSAVQVTIIEECKIFVLSNEQLCILMKDMDEAIRNGLGKETNPSSVVKCYITYVQDLPNGTERGKFLALDLGGTNFRVLLIELGENNQFHMDFETFKVPSHIQTGKGTELFDHIAKCLAEFVKKYNLDNKTALPLGFTFSFPLRQVGLTKGYLNSWTKGFACSGVVDEDVVRLLKDAINRRNDVQIDVCGILNDTTGTLMSCAWKTPNTKIGLIVGTLHTIFYLL
ncbi:hexokinase type 2-like, partial [Myzus persicae]|uniref:hexokinase type 2-like n=1 Tax=Myzus persicae TaxID=13164 RepID=UPI000B9339B0